MLNSDAAQPVLKPLMGRQWGGNTATKNLQRQNIKFRPNCIEKLKLHASPPHSCPPWQSALPIHLSLQAWCPESSSYSPHSSRYPPVHLRAYCRKSRATAVCVREQRGQGRSDCVHFHRFKSKKSSKNPGFRLLTHSCEVLPHIQGPTGGVDAVLVRAAQVHQFTLVRLHPDGATVLPRHTHVPALLVLSIRVVGPRLQVPRSATLTLLIHDVIYNSKTGRKPLRIVSFDVGVKNLALNPMVEFLTSAQKMTARHPM